MIYIANEYEPNYELSTWKNLGPFSALDSAQRCVVKQAFSQMHDYNVFDPAKRYALRENERWVDRWVCMLGISEYKVEAWTVDGEQCTSPAETWHFNFDAWFKRRIVDESLDSSTVRALLTDWKTNPEKAYENLVADCFSKKRERFLQHPGDLGRDAWIDRHGHKEAYPCGEWDSL